MSTPNSADMELERESDHNTNKNNNNKINGSYDDKISALPKFKGWFNRDLLLYQGFFHRPVYLRGLLRFQDHFNAQSSDVLITSFPKSGCTWLKALVFAIVNRTRYDKETHPLLHKSPHDCIRFLDVDIYLDGLPTTLDNFPSPRLFAAHAPYTTLPSSVTDGDCKIIYICRDPKDVLISLYYFMKKILPQMEIDGWVATDEFTLKHAYDSFCAGVHVYGPYFDHVLGYWKASMEKPQKILFLKYEDLKKDLLSNMKKLAEFLGQPFSTREEEEGEVQYIADLCNFKSLSRQQVNKTATSLYKFTNDAFFRKGIVGDWKTHFTPDMIEHLNQLTKQKLEGSGLTLC